MGGYLWLHAQSPWACHGDSDRVVVVMVMVVVMLSKKQSHSIVI